MIRKGGTFIVAGVKTHNALNNFYTDKLLFNEIAMLGVLSSDWSDTAKAVELLKAHWQELKVLCTHAYPIGEAEKAVRVLGREIEDGGDPVHIYLDTTIAP
jgi:threonine dehydrogenase-like Zn-dependent dehydrogenase